MFYQDSFPLYHKFHKLTQIKPLQPQIAQIDTDCTQNEYQACCIGR